MKLVNTALNGGFVLKLLSAAVGEDIPAFIDPFARAAAFDFLCGVSALVRGKDWDPTSRFAIAEQLAYAYVHRCYLGRWRGAETPVLYTPLLLDDSQRKIGKSRKDAATTIAHLEGLGVAPLSLLAYVCSLAEGRAVTCPAELARYHERFDLVRFGATESIAYYEEQVLEVDREVKRQVRDRFGGEDQAAALAALHAEIVSGRSGTNLLT